MTRSGPSTSIARSRSAGVNASGVTGCLKNLAYGSFNNVNRTHTDPKTYTDPVIAVMCTAAPIRYKSVLHIMDGLKAVYHAGPFSWNPEFHWEARSLLFGTDPVAVDRIELATEIARRRPGPTLDRRRRRRARAAWARRRRRRRWSGACRGSGTAAARRSTAAGQGRVRRGSPRSR